MYIRACSIRTQCRMVVSENDRCMSRPQLSSRVSSATVNHAKNVCDNIGVVRYAERSHIKGVRTVAGGAPIAATFFRPEKLIIHIFAWHQYIYNKIFVTVALFRGGALTTWSAYVQPWCNVTVRRSNESLRMASSRLFVSLPNQPKSFCFPKREFGKSQFLGGASSYPGSTGGFGFTIANTTTRCYASRAWKLTRKTNFSGLPVLMLRLSLKDFWTGTMPVSSSTFTKTADVRRTDELFVCLLGLTSLSILLHGLLIIICPSVILIINFNINIYNGRIHEY